MGARRYAFRYPTDMPRDQKKVLQLIDRARADALRGDRVDCSDSLRLALAAVQKSIATAYTEPREAGAGHVR